MRRRGSPVVAERRARGKRDKAATRGLWPDDPDSPRLKEHSLLSVGGGCGGVPRVHGLTSAAVAIVHLLP